MTEGFEKFKALYCILKDKRYRVYNKQMLYVTKVTF